MGSETPVMQISVITAHSVTINTFSQHPCEVRDCDYPNCTEMEVETRRVQMICL